MQRERIHSSYEARKGLIIHLLIFARSWWITLIAMLSCGIIASVYVFFFAVPEYKSSCSVFILRSDIDTTRIYESIILTETVLPDFVQFVSSEEVISKALSSLSLTDSYTVEEIRENLKVVNIPSTKIIKISYNDTYAENSSFIVNAIASSFEEYLNNFLEQRKMNVKISYTLEKSDIPSTPSWPNIPLTIFFSMLFGLAVSAFIISAMTASDEGIKYPEQIYALFELRPLAVIWSIAE